MNWTDLITESRMVTSIYGGATSLAHFALEDLVFSGRSVRLRGDFAQMPDPLPERWASCGFTRAGATFNASDVVEAKVTGMPQLHFDDRHCLEGDPVSLAVEQTKCIWTAPDGTERPYIVLSGNSDFLEFRFVCKNLRVGVKGYTPAPY
ncbi:hypothetical protein CRI94_00575 [Longibacter salinarum]|uniref:Uncharacterized protein n=1 Tax=Longibacter salinarum TaxID=1850348 RepID=A0A2A8D1K8_9BACT|nr:hypothetical protein [Longibacter salinarum]PEN14825.1 hypothetical protein CRI94_00575 [Longibacter salinarum]